MILAGKTIAASGAGLGLGREVAACALRDGANFVLDARSEEKLDETAQSLYRSGELMRG